MSTKSSAFFKRAWERIRLACSRNLIIKSVALIFAILLWGYVLTDLNPYRTKTISNVSVTFEGESELMAQGLCVRGDRSEILSAVTASVNARISDYSEMGPGNVRAVISLRNISEARTYTLPVTATVTGASGEIKQVTPEEVTVEIDTLVTKTVPVTTRFTGELPEGFYADIPASSSTTKVDIQGPKKDIDRVKRAECEVDYTGCTSLIYSIYDIVLYDGTDDVVDSDILVGTVPVSTVRLPIYPTKTVPVNLKDSLAGEDNLAAGFELYEISCNPVSVRLIGEQSALDAVDAVLLEPVNLGGRNAFEVIETKMILPEGVRSLEESTVVNVTADIRETMDEQTYEAMPFKIEGQEEGTEVRVEPETVDVLLSGRISLITAVKRGDISLTADVTGLTPGTYEMEPEIFIRDEETTVELNVRLLLGATDVDKITVTITAAAEE